MGVSAPTLWEEGRMAGSRVMRLAVAGRLWSCSPWTWRSAASSPYSSTSVSCCICVAAALAVRPRDFFHVGVLPPLLLLGFITLVAIDRTRAWVAAAG